MEGRIFKYNRDSTDSHLSHWAIRRFSLNESHLDRFRSYSFSRKTGWYLSKWPKNRGSGHYPPHRFGQLSYSVRLLSSGIDNRTLYLIIEYKFWIHQLKKMEELVVVLLRAYFPFFSSLLLNSYFEYLFRVGLLGILVPEDRCMFLLWKFISLTKLKEKNKPLLMWSIKYGRPCESKVSSQPETIKTIWYQSLPSGRGLEAWTSCVNGCSVEGGGTKKVIGVEGGWIHPAFCNSLSHWFRSSGLTSQLF